MFFKQELKGTIENEKKVHCFFIPIVEQIKASDYNKTYIWNLAKEANITRKFYSSPELLARMESGRLGPKSILSCYKVSLTETQHQQLRAVSGRDNVFLGSLNFIYSDIESLIHFVQGRQLEHANPFYEQDTPVNQSVRAA
ncbi:hypothetical protein DGG96_18850 [Legionella qingyii]|uniref:Uncharacterized protein n=1 Tax=Legionella qingyii TaxID=2184757 RepID=A0A317TYH6_9GAMM|nr:hypothetical protein [Legionella qingyii]PWY54099.1 hypothetical protein DGG96_18850 [Legionella qingyii]RUR19355.1 hypothetical protein ELY20_15960 [Legionella qingyii]RUR21715.1 hypothetical protein ELY16_15895 [Legionella qingyii]